MLTRIIEHEWKLLRADATAALMIALFALAIGCGVIGGSRWVNFQQRSLDELRREETSRTGALLEQARIVEASFGEGNRTTTDSWDPRHPYYIGNTRGQRYAWLPPSPLAMTAIGQSDLYPHYFKVSTDLKQNFTGAYELENPLKLLVGRFDLAFVLLYLFPLLILALSFNLLAGERENGTLSLLLSQPVKLRTIVLGKSAVRALIAFLPVLAFAIIGLLVAGVKLYQPAALFRFGLWAVAVIAYGAFWFALAMLVNARGGSSAGNALILAGVWLALVVLAPSAVNAVATSLHPAPSRVEYIQALREASEGEAAARGKIMAAFYEDHPELAAQNGANRLTRRDEFTLTRERLNKRTEELMQPLATRFEQQLTRQQAFVNRFRFLSPAILMQQALYDIAGTGVPRYRHFMAQVDRYHREWKGFFNPLIARRQLISTSEFSRVPAYRYVEESAGSLVWRTFVPFFSLSLMTLGLAFISLRAYRRYRVAR